MELARNLTWQQHSWWSHNTICYQSCVAGSPCIQDSQGLLGYPSLSLLLPLEARRKLYHSSKVSQSQVQLYQNHFCIAVCLQASVGCSVECIHLIREPEFSFSWMRLWINRMVLEMLSYDCIHSHYRPVRKVSQNKHLHFLSHITSGWVFFHFCLMCFCCQQEQEYNLVHIHSLSPRHQVEDAQALHEKPLIKAYTVNINQIT